MTTKQIKQQRTLENYNAAVKDAYSNILQLTLQLLAQIKRDELRYTLQLNDNSVSVGTLHELVNPLFYLRLECYESKRYCIHYGFLPTSTFANLTGIFSRSVYRFTSKEHSPIYIEDSIGTSRFIHNPDELYEYLEERAEYHQFYLIKYKSAGSKRKQMKAVA